LQLGLDRREGAIGSINCLLHQIQSSTWTLGDLRALRGKPLRRALRPRTQIFQLLSLGITQRGDASDHLERPLFQLSSFALAVANKPRDSGPEPARSRRAVAAILRRSLARIRGGTRAINVELYPTPFPGIGGGNEREDYGQSHQSGQNNKSDHIKIPFQVRPVNAMSKLEFRAVGQLSLAVAPARAQTRIQRSLIFPWMNP
jgi:hypothetical protein